MNIYSKILEKGGGVYYAFINIVNWKAVCKNMNRIVLWIFWDYDKIMIEAYYQDRIHRIGGILREPKTVCK